MAKNSRRAIVAVCSLTAGSPALAQSRVCGRKPISRVLRLAGRASLRYVRTIMDHSTRRSRPTGNEQAAVSRSASPPRAGARVVDYAAGGMRSSQ